MSTIQSSVGTNLQVCEVKMCTKQFYVNDFLQQIEMIEVLDCDLEQSITDENSSATVPSRKNQIKPKPKNNKTLEEPTAAFKVFEQSLKFIVVFGALIGIDMSYEWKRNPRFFILKIVMGVFGLLIIYTQLLHVYNNENKRILEEFALYGIELSVI